MNKEELLKALDKMIELLKKERPTRTIDSVTFIEAGNPEPFRVK